MTSRDELATQDRQLDAFAAAGAHQLGEAVALLRGSAAMLRAERGSLSVGAAEALRTLDAGVDRAQRFADDLLDILQVSRTPPQVTVVDLAAVLDEACEELAVELARADARVTSGSLPVMRADRRQVQRLLVHLVRTALAAGAKHIHVSAEEEPGAVVLIVADDGASVPDDRAEAAFEPFARTRARGPLAGAGVSLALCRRIAEAHGGSATIARRSGGGSETVLTVPQPPTGRARA